MTSSSGRHYTSGNPPVHVHVDLCVSIVQKTVDFLESTFYGPVVGLPAIAIFMSATGYDTRLITFICIGSIVALVIVGFLHYIDRYTKAHLISTVASALLIGSVVVTHWPLRVAFSAAQPSLERIADRYCGDKEMDGSERAGVFMIDDAVLDEAGACRLSILRRYDHSEFVRLPAGRSIEALQPSSRIKLREDWYHITTPASAPSR